MPTSKAERALAGLKSLAAAGESDTPEAETMLDAAEQFEALLRMGLLSRRLRNALKMIGHRAYQEELSIESEGYKVHGFTRAQWAAHCDAIQWLLKL